ncbi:MAG: hypothetical protein WD071_07690 [Pseudohongiella sp.]
MSHWAKFEDFSVTGVGLYIALPKRLSNIVQFIGIFQAEMRTPGVVRFN